MTAQLNNVSPTLVHYHTGKVDYIYLRISDIVSDLPVFLAI